MDDIHSKSNLTSQSILKNPRLDFHAFEAFEVYNDNGFIYNFANPNLDESVLDVANKEYYYSANHNIWHLSSITDPLKTSKIKFSYITNNSKGIFKNQTRTYLGDYKINSSLSDIDNCNCTYTDGTKSLQMTGLFWDDVVNNKYNKTDTRYNKLIENKISQIDWDEGTVNFYYKLKREDHTDLNALTDIVITNKNQEIVKHIKLHYDYLTSEPSCNLPECKRLILRKISQIAGSKSILLYTFNYDTSRTLPRRNSHEKDYLGFYNAVNGSTRQPLLFFSPNQKEYSFLPFQLNNSYKQISSGRSLMPNENSLNGLLIEVVNLTKGRFLFEYENHSFSFKEKDVAAGGARIKKIQTKYRDGKKQTLEYSYLKSNGNSSGSINSFPAFAGIRDIINNQRISN